MKFGLYAPRMGKLSNHDFSGKIIQCNTERWPSGLRQQVANL